MRKELMFSSKTDEWATPQDFFEELNAEFNFDLDPCATDENHKCDLYFTEVDDGLSKMWGGTKYSAIHLMGGKSQSGWRRHTRNPYGLIRWSLCCFQLGQIHCGSISSFTTRQK